MAAIDLSHTILDCNQYSTDDANNLIIQAWIQSVECYGTSIACTKNTFAIDDKVSNPLAAPKSRRCKMSTNSGQQSPSRKPARLYSERQVSREERPVMDSDTTPTAPRRVGRTIPMLPSPATKSQTTPLPITDNSEPQKSSLGQVDAFYSNASASTDPYVHALHRTASDIPPSLSFASTPTKSISTTSTKSRASSPSKRVKRMADLQLNEVPIEHQTLRRGQSLPTNVQSLYTKIRHIASGVGIVPEIIAADFEKRLLMVDEELMPHNLRVLDTHGSVHQRQPNTRPACMRELSVIRKVAATTRRWLRENVSESSWNSSVHVPLLDLAVNGTSFDLDGDDDTDDEAGDESENSPVSFWDVTIARPHRAFLPIGASGDTLEAKMVDFCLTVSDESITSSSRRTLQHLSTTSNNILNRSINHTEYAPLILRPISVSIETKTPDGSVQEGKAQLAIWAAAHFNRLRTLMAMKQTVSGDGLPVVSSGLPLLLISGSVWTLLFAIDKPNSMVRPSCCCY